MNRYIVTDGRIIDRWHAEADERDGMEILGDLTPAERARRWNREAIQAAARRRGVKP